MNTLVLLVLFAALLAMFSLGAGVLSMAVGGRFDDEHADHLMMARVGSQGAALALMFLAYQVA